MQSGLLLRFVRPRVIDGVELPGWCTRIVQLSIEFRGIPTPRPLMTALLYTYPTIVAAEAAPDAYARRDLFQLTLDGFDRSPLLALRDALVARYGPIDTSQV